MVSKLAGIRDSSLFSEVQESCLRIRQGKFHYDSAFRSAIFPGPCAWVMRSYRSLFGSIGWSLSSSGPSDVGRVSEWGSISIIDIGWGCVDWGMV